MKIKKFRRSILIVLALMMVIAQASFTVFALQSTFGDIQVVDNEDDASMMMASHICSITTEDGSSECGYNLGGGNVCPVMVPYTKSTCSNKDGACPNPTSITGGGACKNHR